MQREIDYFNEALKRDPEDRAAFIREKHWDDPELVERLLRLLDAHGRGGIETVDAPVAYPETTEDQPPEKIGQYRVLERIGEGGMGVVYAAEQIKPFRRRVAIKVIKLGMDTREILARFETERQAMAMMDHPGVAKALDAGVTDEGRSYFVMELVKGLPLIEYCAKNRVPVRDRLRLFAEVCAAIQHAHHKGVIHRDLKPSNILVTLQEGLPFPKVIDFGVAKATALQLTEKSVFTEQGRLIGTPEYMSPEQAEMSGLDVDTRADVYSLGVVLYQLLTGVLPFDSKELRSGGYGEVLRIIREVNPPRPSVRLEALARKAPRDAFAIRAQARSVRGELDWIVMRALEKDRTRRYSTASALRDDIERYLTDRRVLAGPPSVTYSLRKFVRRHRLVTALIGLAALSVIVGLTGLTVGLSRAHQARELADQRAGNAQATAEFLEQLLFQADPEYGSESTSLLELMEIAGRSIAEDLGPYPEVEASVRESLGVAYRRRSMFPEAAPHLWRSLEIRRNVFGDVHPETAQSQIAVADLLFEHEGNIDESLGLLGQAFDGYQAHGLGGTTADAWLQLDIGIVNLAGDGLAEAERAFEECRSQLSRDRGPSHPDISRPVRGLAMVALGRGDLEEAVRRARQAVALCEGGQEPYLRARAELVLARVLLEGDQLDEAADVLEEVGEKFAKTVGNVHIRIAERDATLSELQLRQGNPALAKSVAARSEALRRRVLQEDHWAILEARILFQRASIGLGELDSVDSELREIREAAAGRLGPDHPLVLAAVSAQLDYATAVGDASLASRTAEQLSRLTKSRAERLRAEFGE